MSFLYFLMGSMFGGMVTVLVFALLQASADGE